MGHGSYRRIPWRSCFLSILKKFVVSCYNPFHPLVWFYGNKDDGNLKTILCGFQTLIFLNRTFFRESNLWNSSKPPSSDPNREKKKMKAGDRKAGGRVKMAESLEYRQKYRDLLDKAQNECPPPDESKEKNKRGRTKRSKARNLRLQKLGKFFIRSSKPCDY